MKLWSLTCRGWFEVFDIPAALQLPGVHTLLLFKESLCKIAATAEVTPSTALILNVNASEVKFQKDDDTRPTTALLCFLAVMMPVIDDSDVEYHLKVHCQVADQHLEFTLPHSNVAFEEDELSAATPEEFVKMIVETDNVMVSEVDNEAHITTPAQDQLKMLIFNLENYKKLSFSSPVTSLPSTKLHHFLSARDLCELRVKEIQMMAENKQLDFNTVIFHVVNHRTISAHFEIVKGNQTFAAYLRLKNARKAVPSSLKCKIYERNENYGPLEIALTAGKTNRDHPLSYLEKVGAMRKTLEKNGISRDTVTKKKSVELKTLFLYLFPCDEMPNSAGFLISLPQESFDKCLAVSAKFTTGDVCYSTKKGSDFCPQQYKNNNIKELKSDSFWASFCKSYRQNSSFALDVLSKMSLTYGIEDALKDFKATEGDFEQLLRNSGITFAGSFEDAVEAFGLNEDITPAQAHFLLSNRSIQKLLTRKPNFDVTKAKENINTFLSVVNNIKFEHLPDLTDLQNFQVIACFGEFEWANYVLPNDCLIMDFFYGNDQNLGEEIPVTWLINFLTKLPQKPENGNLPKTANQCRLYFLSDGAEKNGDFARSALQDKADEKTIEIGSVMDIKYLSSLFKFAEDKAACLIHEPPLEWINLIIHGIVNHISQCPKITISTKSENKAQRFKEELINILSSQWHQKADELATTSKPRAKQKRKSTSVAPPPAIPPPPTPPTQT